MRIARAFGLAAMAVGVAYALLKKTVTRAASLVLEDVVVTLPSAVRVQIMRAGQVWQTFPPGTVVERIQAAGTVNVMGWARLHRAAPCAPGLPCGAAAFTVAFEVVRFPEPVELADGRRWVPPVISSSSVTAWLRMPDGSRKTLVLSEHGSTVEVDLARATKLYSGRVRRLWAIVGASAHNGTDVLDLTDAEVEIDLDDGLLRIQH